MHVRRSRGDVAQRRNLHGTVSRSDVGIQQVESDVVRGVANLRNGGMAPSTPYRSKELLALLLLRGERRGGISAKGAVVA